MALYIQHWPGFFLNSWSNDAYLEGLAQCVEQGLTQTVGVSNFNEQRVRHAAQVLRGRGTSLSSNQVQYSLLYRKPEKNGGETHPLPSSPLLPPPHPPAPHHPPHLPWALLWGGWGGEPLGCALLVGYADCKGDRLSVAAFHLSWDNDCVSGGQMRHFGSGSLVGTCHWCLLRGVLATASPRSGMFCEGKVCGSVCVCVWPSGHSPSVCGPRGIPQAASRYLSKTARDHSLWASAGAQISHPRAAARLNLMMSMLRHSAIVRLLPAAAMLVV